MWPFSLKKVFRNNLILFLLTTIYLIPECLCLFHSHSVRHSSHPHNRWFPILQTTSTTTTTTPLPPIASTTTTPITPTTSTTDKPMELLNQNVVRHQPLLSPVQAAQQLKLNRYRAAGPVKLMSHSRWIQPIAVNAHRADLISSNMRNGSLLLEPHIEVPSLPWTPLSLVFRSSSSPLNIQHQIVEHRRHEPFIELVMVQSPTAPQAQRQPVAFEGTVPLSFVPLDHQPQPPSHHPLSVEAIKEAMVVAQDVSHLYETLLLSSLVQPSSISGHQSLTVPQKHQTEQSGSIRMLTQPSSFGTSSLMMSPFYLDL